ncbi:hypothetical protein C8K30_109236 [Promicromonospora sp. AC04]|uniref:hypothetical protein n=1 Tax=Promicromonospora sp. AC04 TaxID=2135723 RepID=UPI000D38A4A6|nr:hypothetical protein [Promicromonospora sp. AC04]PUB24484.1 hypothetical protein C8K30_109236 [Promicromonospora sp. AC04]
MSTRFEPGDDESGLSVIMKADPEAAVLPPRQGRTASRWPWVLLRITASLALAGMIGQAALAGGFLSGFYPALEGHARLGTATSVMIMLQAVACVAVWKRGGGPSWPLRASIAQVVVAIALWPLGELRILALHLPVAVALGIGVAFVAVWSWRSSAPRGAA